ncbi:anti-sigma factor family protein [Parasphingorhabdus pacifica]
MTGLRGWGLPEGHLALDALVAFVDGELSPSAHDRAVAHLAHCPACASDASSQRQARAAVQSAETPSISSGLLHQLQSIPTSAELPDRPDELGVTEDGQLVAVDPTRARGKSTPLGAGAKFGNGHAFGTGTKLGDRAEQNPSRQQGRRTRQGAGVVFSGLVLGALALMTVPTEDEQENPVNGPAPYPGGPHDQAVVPASAGESTSSEPAPSSRPRVAANTATVPATTSLASQP